MFYRNKMIQIDVLTCSVYLIPMRPCDMSQIWAPSFKDHFGSLSNCLRKDSWVEWELLWMLMEIWSIDSKTQVSKCEWEEWIDRADDAQEFPWLTYWITFSTHIFKFEPLLKRIFVNLHQAKGSQTRHCDEKLRFAFCTTIKLEET